MASRTGVMMVGMMMAAINWRPSISPCSIRAFRERFGGAAAQSADASPNTSAASLGVSYVRAGLVDEDGRSERLRRTCWENMHMAPWNHAPATSGIMGFGRGSDLYDAAAAGGLIERVSHRIIHLAWILLLFDFVPTRVANRPQDVFVWLGVGAWPHATA